MELDFLERLAYLLYGTVVSHYGNIIIQFRASPEMSMPLVATVTSLVSSANLARCGNEYSQTVL